MPARAGSLKRHMKEKPKLDLSKVVLSPMPGVVKSVAVEVGQMVGEGIGKFMNSLILLEIGKVNVNLISECCVVEAMKMQNSMKAGVTGKVKAVHVKAGDLVDEEQVLVELE